MANRAEGTIETYAASIRRFEEYLGNDLADARQETVRRWVDLLVDRRSVSHASGSISRP